MIYPAIVFLARLPTGLYILTENSIGLNSLLKARTDVLFTSYANELYNNLRPEITSRVGLDFIIGTTKADYNKVPTKYRRLSIL